MVFSLSLIATSGLIVSVNNVPGKERVPWERACTVYTYPQDHLRFQDGGGAVYSDSLVIGGREMIDDLPDPGSIEEKKYSQKWLL